MAKKKCKHSYSFWVDSDENPTGHSDSDAFRLVCQNCGEYLSIGPSNDEPAEVQIEMRAAELSLGWEGPPPISGEEYVGWQARHDQFIELDSDARLAGWLSRETRYGDTELDIGEWPWDPTRPVAGQYEEWMADNTPIIAGAASVVGLTRRQARDATAEGIAVEDSIREQTRHDVAASVVRHSDHEPPGRVPYAEDQIELPVAVAAWDAWAKDNMKTVAPPARPAGWGRDLDAIEAENTRAAEPDCRDEDDPLTGEHTADCDKQTDTAFPCNCKSELVDYGAEIADPADDQLVAAIAHSPPREPPAEQQAEVLVPPPWVAPVERPLDLKPCPEWQDEKPDGRFDDGGDS